jgi:hypothetical protein
MVAELGAKRIGMLHELLAKAGTPIEITFVPLPVGWECKAGSHVRLAVAGGDRDHIVQVPHGRPPRLTHHGTALPFRSRA